MKLRQAAGSKASLRRTMFLFGSGAGVWVSIFCTWLDWRSGLVSSLPQDITLSLVLIPLFFWAWKTVDPTAPARVGMMIFILSFAPSIPTELIQMPVFLLWLPAVPLLASCFFGFREGLIWSAGFLVLVLAESMWVISSAPVFPFETMFAVAILVYLFLSGAAAAFQYLVESYERRIHLEAVEKQRVRERMAEMQKLETISLLAGGIAHDFNNLLVGVMGNAELAMLEASKHGEEQHYLKGIIKSAQCGAELVRHMLAYSGQGKISMGEQNLNELVLDVSELLRAVIDKSVHLEISLMPLLPNIIGDKNELTQLIINLLTNASEAMTGEAGGICLRTGVRHLLEQDFSCMHLLDDNLREGVFVFLQVEDSGCGMQPDIQTRIFDPFFTTKETGSGLGLAALLGIVRSHGGTLSVTSAPGEGSSFIVYFPVIAGE